MASAVLVAQIICRFGWDRVKFFIVSCPGLCCAFVTVLDAENGRSSVLMDDYDNAGCTGLVWLLLNSADTEPGTSLFPAPPHQ